jgi:hypothetical protein
MVEKTKGKGNLPKREFETKFEIIAELKELKKGEERPTIKAYLFSPSGELLDSQPLDAKGQTTLATKRALRTRGRFQVVVGPETEQIKRLRDFRARTQIVHADPDSEVIKVPTFEILKPTWSCWFGTLYNIVGEVKKKIVVDADTTVYVPICEADVEIYEVDYRKCILTLPDSIIEKIREELLERVKPWPPWPPRYIDKPKVMPRVPKPPAPITVELGPRWSSFGAEASSEHTVLEYRSQTFSATELASDVSFAEIESGSTARFRQFLLDKASVFRPLMCLWFPHLFFYSVTSLGTVKTDVTGHFQKSIIFWCPTEEPDLYFVVRQTIGGLLKNVYAPRPVPCYTHWNYKSGTNVTLIVTDPDAYGCFEQVPTDKTGVYVMPLGIGWDGWYEVQQAHIKPPAIYEPDRGLYMGINPSGDPYGTRLDITMQFHDGLRSLPGDGVWYYRWSYRKEGTTNWTHITTPIIHRHLTMVAGEPAIMAERLGPTDVGSESDLFEVPDPSKDWVVINQNDRAFAIWHTARWEGGDYIPNIPNGKYELQLEMFDENGNNVTPAAAGFTYFLPTGPVAGGVLPVDDSLYVEPGGGIILRLHIDNSDTVADIQSIALGGELAEECQFLEYQNKLTDEVAVTYVAYHPNGYLDHYDLNIKRGISGTIVGSLPAPATTPATTPTTQLFTVQNLLRQIIKDGQSYGPYDQCAFAVELHTWPRTRDGYSRIRAYEAHDTSAFALVKKMSFALATETS